MAYIANSTSERDRGAGMGCIGAAMGVGMVLGPGIGGWLAGHSMETPFFLAAGLSLIALRMIWLLLPESLVSARRAESGTGCRRATATLSLSQTSANPRRPGFGDGRK